MPFAVTTPPVKMRLERSAERDKREIINILSAEYAQSERGAHFKSSRPLACIYHIFIDNKPHFAVNWEHKTGAAPEKGRKTNERYRTL